MAGVGNLNFHTFMAPADLGKKRSRGTSGNSGTAGGRGNLNGSFVSLCVGGVV